MPSAESSTGSLTLQKRGSCGVFVSLPLLHPVKVADLAKPETFWKGCCFAKTEDDVTVAGSQFQHECFHRKSKMQQLTVHTVPV